MLSAESFTNLLSMLSNLVVFRSHDFEQFLKKLIKIIIKVIPVDSCFIYFYDREKKELILVASKKTHKKQIGNISLKRGEGITGWVAAHKKTVVLEKNAYKDERFKFFKELPEDKFEAFMSVPIIDRDGVVGVVNLQNKKPYKFTKDQITIIEAIVYMIASAFESVLLTRRVGSLELKLEERKIIERAKGILMEKRRMSESQAFALMRRDAMKHRKSLKEIAEAILLVWG